MLNILVIEKNLVIRAGLATVFSGYFGPVRFVCVSTLAELPVKPDGNKSDLVILGTKEAGNGALQNIHKIKKSHPDSALIIYDQQKEWQVVSAYLRAGASGYLCKESELTEMITCVKTVLNGQRYLPLHVHLGLLNCHENSKFAECSPLLRLSSGHYLIAQYLAHGLSTPDIARKLRLKNSTVSAIKLAILRKLKISHVMQLVELVN